MGELQGRCLEKSTIKGVCAIAPILVNGVEHLVGLWLAFWKNPYVTARSFSISFAKREPMLQLDLKIFLWIFYPSKEGEPRIKTSCPCHCWTKYTTENIVNGPYRQLCGPREAGDTRSRKANWTTSSVTKVLIPSRTRVGTLVPANTIITVRLCFFPRLLEDVATILFHGLFSTNLDRLIRTLQGNRKGVAQEEMFSKAVFLVLENTE
jgi:hypothetical protein